MFHIQSYVSGTSQHVPCLLGSGVGCDARKQNSRRHAKRTARGAPGCTTRVGGTRRAGRPVALRAQAAHDARGARLRYARRRRTTRGAPGCATRVGGAPRGAQRAPRGAQRAPRGAQGAPRGAQGAPRGAQRAPRGAQRAPRGAQGAPRGAQGAPRGGKVHDARGARVRCVRRRRTTRGASGPRGPWEAAGGPRRAARIPGGAPDELILGGIWTRGDPRVHRGQKWSDSHPAGPEVTQNWKSAKSPQR